MIARIDKRNCTRYVSRMIVSFANAETEAVFNGDPVKGLQPGVCKTARRKLDQINSVSSVDQLKSPPGNKLHPLTKDRSGQWAIWINDQYRICFRFENGLASMVEIVNYH